MSKQRGRGALHRKITGVLACGLAALAVLPAAVQAAPRPPIETIVQDDAALLHQPEADVKASLERLKSLGVDRVRITAGWSVLAPEPDSPTRPEGFDASDPDAYPKNAFWESLDRAVRLSSAAGVQVMIDIAFWAPLWATQGDPNRGRANWNINTGEYAEFTKAIVRRYSGDFTPKSPEPDAPPPRPQPPSRDQNFLEGLFGGFFFGGGGGSQRPPAQQSARETRPRTEPLPAVKWWTIWNEPNHPGFIQPQWKHTSSGWRPRSPHIYRQLVEAAYPAIKGIQPDSLVLVGGTSSTGPRKPTGEQSGVQPLRFIRELACVDERLRPISTGDCAGYRPLAGDGFSHHPYSLMHRPDHTDPRNPDNLPIGALDRLTDTLNKLARMGRIDPKLRDVYLTEFGYETNPPDPIKPWNPEQQARFLNWSEYLGWKNRNVRSWPQFLLRDMGTVSAADAERGKRDFGDWQSGLLFQDGTPKPSATSFKLALFAECVKPRPAARRSRRARRSSSAPRTVRIWGHIRPGSGARQVTLTQRKSRAAWRTAATASSPRAGARASRALAFQSNATGAFVRYAPYQRGGEYRLDAQTAGEPGLPVTPVGCGGRAK